MIAPAAIAGTSSALRPERSASMATERFQSLLAQAAPAAKEGEPDPAIERRVREKAHASAETLVAQTLIAPLLAQLRDTNHAPEPFGVSEAEKRLGPVFDERIATQVVRRSKFPIVAQVERSLLKRSGLDVVRGGAGSAAQRPATSPTGLRKDLHA